MEKNLFIFIGIGILFLFLYKPDTKAASVKEAVSSALPTPFDGFYPALPPQNTGIQYLPSNTIGNYY